MTNDLSQVTPTWVTPTEEVYNVSISPSRHMKRNYYLFSSTPNLQYKLEFNGLSEESYRILQQHWRDVSGVFGGFHWRSIPKDYMANIIRDRITLTSLTDRSGFGNDAAVSGTSICKGQNAANWALDYDGVNDYGKAAGISLAGYPELVIGGEFDDIALGSEMLPNNNAVSDGQTEANATTGYNSVSTPDVFESTGAGIPNVGSYHFHVDNNSGGWKGFNKAGLTFVTGACYLLSFDYKRVDGTNLQVNMTDGNGAAGLFLENSYSSTSYVSINIYFNSIAGGSSGAVNFISDNGNAEFYVDNISLKRVTFVNFTENTGWGPQAVNKVLTGKAQKIAGTAGNLEQTTLAAEAGKVYRLGNTIIRTAGSVTPEFGSTDGAAISANGTYYDYLIATDTDYLKFKADATFAGSIDVATVKESVDILTYTAWINPKGEQTGGSTNQIILNKSLGVSHGLYVDYYSSPNRFGIAYEWSGGTVSSAFYNVSTYDQWYFLVGTYSISTELPLLYINGSNVATGAILSDISAPTMQLSSVSIGGGISDRYSSMKIGECRIYDRELTAASIATLYSGGSITGGLLGRWDCNDVSMYGRWTSGPNIKPYARSWDVELIFEKDLE